APVHVRANTASMNAVFFISVGFCAKLHKFRYPDKFPGIAGFFNAVCNLLICNKIQSVRQDLFFKLVFCPFIRPKKPFRIFQSCIRFAV
ncbi:MAG: hypothetical protein MJY75_07495, partial [Bacteroidaceae bacterium]|nr:hypothetical protein [Bacteroidaceae bacterium]